MLIIIESPKKTKHIAEYAKCKVMATVGHIKDLPTDEMGLDEKLDPKFLATERGRKTLSDIKTAARGENVVIATDPDREGFAIGYHVYEEIKSSAKSITRAEIREITQKGVDDALKAAQPMSSLSVYDYHAFLGRRVGDRVIGYTLSPKISNKLKMRGAKAGRVQSPALCLVVEREEAIRLFKPENYYECFVTIEKNGASVKGESVKNRFQNKADCDSVTQRILNSRTATVIAVKHKDAFQNPKPPFSTLDLYAAASAYLKLSPEKSKKLVEELFANTLVTYIRTDSFRLSDEWTLPAIDYLRQIHPEATANSPIMYKSKNSQAEAHEAIRPTSIYPLSEIKNICSGQGLTDEHATLLELIWRRTYASQMTPARIATSEIRMQANEEEILFKGKVLKDPGFYAIWTYTDSKEVVLPPINEGDTLQITGAETLSKKTKPPGRYSEASLLKKMEELGIGRPSTYASLLGSIKNSNYTKANNKGHLEPTSLGESIINAIRQDYPWLLEYSFTAEMESCLDDIAGKHTDWKDFAKTLVEKVGGLPAARSTGTSSPPTETRLSEKQLALIEKNADEKVKKAVSSGDFAKGRKWLDQFFKDLEKDKNKNPSGTNSKGLRKRK